jgi:hypothetical protein
VTAVTTKTVDPIEAARKILNAQAASLADLEAADAALAHVRDETDVEIAGMAARRREILAADGPSHEIDARLEKHDATVRALVRRNEVAAAISAKLSARLMAAREDAAEEKRREAYNAALAQHTETTSLIKTFLQNVAPAARAALQAYAESEAAVAAVNRDLPAGAAPLASIEQERRGEMQTRETVVRRTRYFYLGNDRIVEVGRAEAAETSAGVWGVFVPSGSVQGGETFAGCRIVEFLELKVETLKSQPESLMTGVRIPQFHEPYVTAGTSRRAVPAAEWDAANGQPVPRLAAE